MALITEKTDLDQILLDMSNLSDLNTNFTNTMGLPVANPYPFSVLGRLKNIDLQLIALNQAVFTQFLLGWVFNALSDVYSLAIDLNNNIYVGENTNVKKVDPSGNLIWTYNCGAIVNGVCVDTTGYSYCVDGNGYLTKISPLGSLVWTTDVGYALFCVCVDSETGNIYVGGSNLSIVDNTGVKGWSLDTGSVILGINYQVYENFVNTVDENGKLTQSVNGTQTNQVDVTGDGFCVCSDSLNNLITGDGGWYVTKWNTSLTQSWQYQMTGNVRAITTDPLQNVYATDVNGLVTKISPTGSEIYSYSNIAEIRAIVIDTLYEIYIGDLNNNVTQLIQA